jgi:Uma2 family endonuclease
VQQLANYADVHGGRGGPEVHIDFSDEFHRIYRVPDVSFWAPGRARRSGGVGLPPTLAIEVRSPSQTLDELPEKCRFMLASGVEVSWLVVPESRTVEVLEGDAVRTLAMNDELTSEHLPGFALALADLFAVLD